MAPLLNIWEEIWYSKLWNPGSYSQRAESTQAVGFYEHLGFKTYKRTDPAEGGWIPDNPHGIMAKASKSSGISNTFRTASIRLFSGAIPSQTAPSSRASASKQKFSTDALISIYAYSGMAWLMR